MSKELDPNQTREWILNDRVVRFLIEELENYEGYEVLRLDDPTGKPQSSSANTERQIRINKANAWKADLLLDIHHNAAGFIFTGGGITVYAHNGSLQPNTLRYQKTLYDKLVKSTGLKGNRATPMPRANFHMLRESNMSALLPELGFMDSRIDAPIILTAKFAREAAKGICDFLVKEFDLKEKEVKQSLPKGEFYRVQTGAFADKSNADRLEKELRAKGYDTYMVIGEDNLYRVQVGAYSKLSNAKNMEKSLLDNNFDTYITTKSGKPAPKTITGIKRTESVKTGSKVRVKDGARTYTGGGLAGRVYRNTYKVSELIRDRAVIVDGRGTVIAAMNVKDLYVAETDVITPPVAEPTPKIEKGSKVRVKKNVDINGTVLSSDVLKNTYDVLEVNGRRIVIGIGTTVTAAMDIEHLELA